MVVLFPPNKHFDLCVVGAGPAGIMVTIEFCRQNPNKSVLLVEFGQNKQPGKNQLDDSIQIDNLVNHHDPYECTNKGIGGTSKSWGGRCVMYDDIDFMSRPILNGGCTWDPLLFDDVKRYTDRAAAYFECGEAIFNLKDIPLWRRKRISENFVEGDVTDSVIERWSSPTRFGKQYRAIMAGLSNLTIIEGYEARRFSSPDDEGRVATLNVRSVTTNSIIEVIASKFVIAAGGQESTRILLRNKHLFSNLEGGSLPALGRYYQGHLSGKIASVRFTGNPHKTEYGFLRNGDGSYIRRRFQFSKELLIKENLLNTAIWLDNPLYFDPKHRSGPMSFMYLMMILPIIGRKLAPPAIAHSITKGKINSVSKHIRNVLAGLPDSLIKPASIFYKRYCVKRKLPGVFLYSRQNTYALHFHAEQIPYTENKMVLLGDGETLVIQYSLTEADVKSVIALHKLLDQWLRKTGSGQLEYWYPDAEMGDEIKRMSKDGLHQCGTTRIASTDREGVVNADLRLYGTNNIFVCSSSSFPTSGQANPTFLLGAFAIRLADYLTTH